MATTAFQQKATPKAVHVRKGESEGGSVFVYMLLGQLDEGVREA